MEVDGEKGKERSLLFEDGENEEERVVSFGSPVVISHDEYVNHQQPMTPSLLINQETIEIPEGPATSSSFSHSNRPILPTEPSVLPSTPRSHTHLRLPKYPRLVNRDPKPGIFNMRKHGSTHRNLYFSLLDMKWWRLAFVFAVYFFIVHSIFAVLYWTIAPAGITNIVKGESFWRYFFFSVQSMETIGFGFFSPESNAANIIMVIQAAVGVLNTGCITGIIFSKIARPSRMRGTILFSEIAAINYHHPRYVGSVDQLETGRWLDPHKVDPQQHIELVRASSKGVLNESTLAAIEDDSNCPCLILRIANAYKTQLCDPKFHLFLIQRKPHHHQRSTSSIRPSSYSNVTTNLPSGQIPIDISSSLDPSHNPHHLIPRKRNNAVTASPAPLSGIHSATSTTTTPTQHLGHTSSSSSTINPDSRLDMTALLARLRRNGTSPLSGETTESESGASSRHYSVDSLPPTATGGGGWWNFFSRRREGSYTFFGGGSNAFSIGEETEAGFGEDEEQKWMDFEIVELNFEINKQIGRVRAVSMAVPMLPLPWTVVHPIDRHSPLRGETPQSLAAKRTEIVAIVDGISEAVSDNFQARWSYLAQEIVWGAEFLPMVYMKNGAFHIDYERLSEVTVST